MRRHWSQTELAEDWTLLPDELTLIQKMTNNNQLGFAVMLKYFQHELQYPSKKEDIPKVIIAHLAKQLGTVNDLDNYNWHNSTAEKHRAKIRIFLDFSKPNSIDAKKLVTWLAEEVLPQGYSRVQINQMVYDWLRDHKLEPFKEKQLNRYIRSAISRFEKLFIKKISDNLSTTTKESLLSLLQTQDKSLNKYDPTRVKLSIIKSDAGQSNLDSILVEVSKLKCIEQLVLPNEIFASTSPKILYRYRNRVMGEPPRELLRHPPQMRNAMLAIFCYLRKREITDNLIELIIQTIHKISAKAEKRVVREFIADIQKINGKTNILYKVAVASLNHPKDAVENVIYPVAGEQTLRDIVKEYKATASHYILQVHAKTRSSYSNHYRRMLLPILNTLEFCSKNKQTHPILKAINLIKKYAKTSLTFLPTDEDIPIAGIVPDNVKDIVLEETDDGIKVNRINYEIATLQALRGCLRCKEIWVEGADRYRNPDKDLPKDFDEKRDEYYKYLKQPLDVELFIDIIQKEMRRVLRKLNNNLPQNKKVKILEKKKGWIKLTPLTAQPDPLHIEELKSEIANHWSMTSLLDILKETDLLIDFTSLFKSTASREVLNRDVLRKRLLLCLFGLGTNTGLKRISSGNIGVNHQDLRYIKKRFVHKESVRAAITKIVNAVFQIRDPLIWGESTTACASDSKKYGAWNQNLMTEWHARYGGRGIMIYWHVEKKSVCIYSQLKSCSSSEAAAMIEGVLRHCTNMKVKKNYVDSHGQNEVAFAFSYILGFDLLPRFRAIHAQKLYPPEDGAEKRYKNLKPILRKPIKWDLIRKQYDQIIEYATALRLGTADSESILRRFTRNNAKHPVYKALSELGKAIKTIFLCRYLHSEALRQEIQEGLNVIERWNSVNGFIYYGKGGEITSNRRDDQELSMLCLHLLQISLVYINTLMVQQVLASQYWSNRLTLEDKRALTPLFHLHINPYGLFQLDMTKRLVIKINLRESNNA
ncbi:MAG: Tn3 family transposase [Gammaproteobacteria bacterium]|jgi:TnpA family transposase